MTPTELLDAVTRWRPIVYMAARALVYGATFIVGAVAVWYGNDPQPDWLPRSVAVAAFLSGPLALVNLSRPKG